LWAGFGRSILFLEQIMALSGNAQWESTYVIYTVLPAAVNAYDDYCSAFCLLHALLPPESII
jgi:hypothetical protein